VSKLRLTVGVDQNDGDWNEQSSDITQEQLDKLIPVFKAIKKFKPYKGKSGSGLTHTHHHNWPMGEYAPREDLGEKPPAEIYKGILTKKQVELFEEFCTYGEHGFHSVVSVTVYEITKETKYI